METQPPASPVARQDNREPFCNQSSSEWRRPGKQTSLAEPVIAPAAAYPEYVKELADAQEIRLASIEARAASVVTVSGTLVTLLFALTSLVTRVTTFRLPPAATGWLIAAVAAFLISGGASIIANLPQRVWALDPALMREELWDRWGSAGDSPAEKITATRLAQWQASRQLAQLKARLLILAVSAQIVAVGCVAVGALRILT
jgi:hypothetical protein